MHAERLPCTVPYVYQVWCRPTLTAQVIFLLERGHTDTQSQRRYRSPTQVKSSLLNTRLQLKAELIHTETTEKCYA